ncbi:hypothetical protein DPMN_068661 [Dreissena polymorpha]|uniref:Uncharacterized protein n=1 Tax=Dreissena polymorpha TaxID=45954 RepID=A0A9D3Z2V8_DREPO|nr:hypothetical protein DPMN_068661 [Dreissena polymorpha]
MRRVGLGASNHTLCKNACYGNDNKGTNDKRRRERSRPGNWTYEEWGSKPQGGPHPDSRTLDAKAMDQSLKLERANTLPDWKASASGE